MSNTRAQVLLILVILALLVLGLLILWRTGWWQVLTQREALEAFIQRLGPWGPVAVVLGELLQVLLAPIPGQIMGLAAGYLYGVFWGTLLCMAGLALGTMIAMWLARRLGRPLVERFISAERLARLDGYARTRGPAAFFLIYLLPFLPDDLLCFVAGLTPLRISTVVLLAILGRAPGLVVSTWIGAQAQNLTWIQIGLLILASLAMTLLVLRYGQRLEEVMFSLIDRLTHSADELQ